MQYTTLFATLLASAVLTVASPMVGPPAPPPPYIYGDGIFKDIRAKPAAWAGVSAACNSGSTKSTKRSLLPRANPPAGFSEVAQGKYQGQGQFPVGLWTQSLVTCFGIVVTGKVPSDTPNANSRWLLHFQAERTAADWTPFEKDVSAVKLTDMHGFLSVPDLGGTLPDGWDDDMTTLTQDMTSKVLGALNDLVGTDSVAAPAVHSMVPSSTFQVDKDGVVKSNDKVVPP